MKFLFKIFISLFVIFQIVLLVHFVSFLEVVSDPLLFQRFGKEGKGYAMLAESINTRLAASETDIPLQVTERMVASIADPLIQSSVAYVTGRTTSIPSISLDSMFEQVDGLKGFKSSDLKRYREEFIRSMQESDDPEAQKMVAELPNIPETIRLDQQLTPLRTMYQNIRYVPLVLLLFSGIGVFIVLFLCRSWSGRMVWLLGVSVLSAVMLGIGYIIFSTPGFLIQGVNSSTLHADQIVKVGLSYILETASSVYARYHFVGLIISAMVGLIAFFARVLVFKPKKK